MARRTRNQTSQRYDQWIGKTTCVEFCWITCAFHLDIFAFLSANDGRASETVIQEITDKHKQRLADEKSKFHDLTSIVDDYKVSRTQLPMFRRRWDRQRGSAEILNAINGRRNVLRFVVRRNVCCRLVSEAPKISYPRTKKRTKPTYNWSKLSRAT